MMIAEGHVPNKDPGPCYKPQNLFYHAEILKFCLNKWCDWIYIKDSDHVAPVFADMGGIATLSYSAKFVELSFTLI